jgi:hypothetical protein
MLLKLSASPPFSAKVENVWSYTCTHIYKDVVLNQAQGLFYHLPVAASLGVQCVCCIGLVQTLKVVSSNSKILISEVQNLNMAIL